MVKELCNCCGLYDESVNEKEPICKYCLKAKEEGRLQGAKTELEKAITEIDLTAYYFAFKNKEITSKEQLAYACASLNYLKEIYEKRLKELKQIMGLHNIDGEARYWCNLTKFMFLTVIVIECILFNLIISFWLNGVIKIVWVGFL